MLIAAMWQDYSAEQQSVKMKKQWKVEDNIGSLYCINERGEMSNIPTIIDEYSGNADFLIFGHQWDQKKLRLVEQMGKKYPDVTIKCFSFEHSRNFIYFRQNTKKGLYGVYVLGEGETSDNNTVVRSYENHSLYRTNFEEVWNFYYYRFYRHTVDIRANLLQLLGSYVSMGKDDDCINFFQLLNSYPQLLERLHHFIGHSTTSNSIKNINAINIPQFITEQNNDALSKDYKKLTEVISKLISSKLEINQIEAKKILNDFRHLSVSLLNLSPGKIYE